MGMTSRRKTEQAAEDLTRRAERAEKTRRNLTTDHTDDTDRRQPGENPRRRSKPGRVKGPREGFPRVLPAP